MWMEQTRRPYFRLRKGVLKNSNITSEYTAIDDVNIAKLTHFSIAFLVNLALSIFVISRQNLRRKKRNQAFLNLQVTHIVFSVAAIVSESKYQHESVLIYNGLLIGMFSALILVTLERVMAIKFPLRHKQITSKELFVVTMFSWIPAIGFVCISIVVKVSQQRYILITQTVIIILAGIVLTIANGVIYLTAKRHDEFVKRNAANRPSTTDKQGLKASLVCLLMVVSFTLLWFPMLVHNVMSLAGQYEAEDGKLFSDAVQHVAIFNSLADPLLFVWLSTEIKKELKKLYKKKNGTKRTKETHGKTERSAQLCSHTETGTSATVMTRLSCFLCPSIVKSLTELVDVTALKTVSTRISRSKDVVAKTLSIRKTVKSD